MVSVVRRAWTSPWPTALGFASCYAAASVLLLGSSPLPFQDGEALHNATVAREVLTGSGRFLLDFQYRPNCGGCTFMALAGALVFRGFGLTFLVWKAIPIAFGCLIVALGCVLSDRVVGRFANIAFGTLVLGSPVFLQHGMQMAWGTHFEVMVFVLAQALIATFVLMEQGGGRWATTVPLALWGLIAGFGLWFCFSSAFAFPALWLLVALAGPRDRLFRRFVTTLPGLVLGASPLLVYLATTGISPFEITTQSIGDDALSGPFVKLGEVTLVRYVRDLYSVGSDLVFTRAGVFVLIALWSAALLSGLVPLMRWRSLRPHALVPLTLLLAAVLCYVLSSFQVDPFTRGGPPPIINLRYLHPATILLLAAAAAGMGILWRKGTAGGLVAILMLAIAAGPGLYCRLAGVRARPTDDCQVTPQDLQPFDYHWFGVNRLGSVDEDRLLSHAPREWVSRVNHRRSIGARRVSRVVSGRPEQMPQLLLELRSLAGIEDRDVPAVLHGLGLALPSGRSEASDPRLRANTLALLEAANPDERRALAAAIWSNGSLLAEPLTWPLPNTPQAVDQEVGWALSTADCALCPAIGVPHGPLRDPRDLRSLDDLFPEGAADLPRDPRLRQAIIEGRASVYGREFGCCSGPFGSFAATLAPGDRDAAQHGFALGRARHWMFDVQPGTPPDLVP